MLTVIIINTHAIELTTNKGGGGGGLKSVSIIDRFSPPGLVSVGYKCIRGANLSA